MLKLKSNFDEQRFMNDNDGFDLLAKDLEQCRNYDQSSAALTSPNHIILKFWTEQIKNRVKNVYNFEYKLPIEALDPKIE